MAAAGPRAAGDGLPHLHALVNEGREAGASLAPLALAARLAPRGAAGRGGRAAATACRVCALLARELADGARVVAERDGLVAALPVGRPRAVRAADRPGRARGRTASRAALLGPALALAAEGLRRLRAVEGPQPVEPLAPRAAATGTSRSLPRLTILAGLELGAGVYVNALPPRGSRGASGFRGASSL